LLVDFLVRSGAGLADIFLLGIRRFLSY